jgi:hypothetical protein
MDEYKWTLNAVFEWAQRVANGLPSVGLGTDIFEGIEATLKQRHDRIVELEAQRDSIARLGKAVEIENRELKEQRERIMNLKYERDMLITERDTLEKQVRKLEGESNQLQARIMKLEERLLQTQNERNAATQRIRELEAQTTYDTSLDRSSRTTIQMLHKQIAELEAENRTLRNGSISLFDANEALKVMNTELHALNAALVSQSASGAGVMLPEWYVYDNTYQANNAAIGLVHLHWSVASWQIRDDGSIAVMWQRPARGEVKE